MLDSRTEVETTIDSSDWGFREIGGLRNHDSTVFDSLGRPAFDLKLVETQPRSIRNPRD